MSWFVVADLIQKSEDVGRELQEVQLRACESR